MKIKQKLLSTLTTNGALNNDTDLPSVLFLEGRCLDPIVGPLRFKITSVGVLGFRSAQRVKSIRWSVRARKLRESLWTSAFLASRRSNRENCKVVRIRLVTKSRNDTVNDPEDRDGFTDGVPFLSTER